MYEKLKKEKRLSQDDGALCKEFNEGKLPKGYKDLQNAGYKLPYDDSPEEAPVEETAAPVETTTK